MTSLAQFKAAVRKGEHPAPGLLRKAGLLAAVQGVEEQRQLRFTISTGNVDRDNDTIAVSGWDLRSYMQNPVVLWGHDARELPVGKCTSIKVEDGELRAVVDFVGADMPVVGPRAEAVYRMCREGFLSTTSVGFRPLEYKLAPEREDPNGMSWFAPMDFVRHELLEWSIVTVPANPDALIDPTERASFVAAQPAGAAAAAVGEVARKRAAAVRRRDLLLACV